MGTPDTAAAHCSKFQKSADCALRRSSGISLPRATTAREPSGLKEVKIRGEIRTTVDYCVEMIQSPDFVGNNIHTGWLDARITSHVSGSPPP